MQLQSQECTLQAYRSELAPAVMSMLAAASDACPVGAPSRSAMPNGSASNTDVAPAAVLHKEAVYAAVGTGAYELHDFVDYQPWLRTTLVQASLFLQVPLSKHLCSAIVNAIAAML